MEALPARVVTGLTKEKWGQLPFAYAVDERGKVIQHRDRRELHIAQEVVLLVRHVGEVPIVVVVQPPDRHIVIVHKHP